MKRKSGYLITIGSFDGVHKGHMALLDRTVLEARKRRLQSLVLTFNVPPRMVLNNAEPVSVLSDSSEKEMLIKSRGIDKVVCLDFDRVFSTIKPYIFFRDVLLKKYKGKGIVVGLDFRFGSGRSAGAMELVRWGQEVRIPVWVIPPVKVGGAVVSSSVIRQLLTSNDLKRTLNLLGHPYVIHGPVVKGRGIGKKIGFPTTNIKPAKGKVVPQGVFVVRGQMGKMGRKKGKIFKGVCNIGCRPTFYNQSGIVIEPHWFGRPFMSTPATMTIELLHRLRSERKFNSPEALVRAIKSDIQKTRDFFQRETRLTTNRTILGR